MSGIAEQDVRAVLSHKASWKEDGRRSTSGCVPGLSGLYIAAVLALGNLSMGHRRWPPTRRCSGRPEPGRGRSGANDAALAKRSRGLVPDSCRRSFE